MPADARPATEGASGVSGTRRGVRQEFRTREQLVIHSLTWLVVGSAVGLLMATLLLWPSVGALLAPLTYGRWATLHLDLLLYGWCALPVVGLLLDGFGATLSHPRLARSTLAVWSGTLLFAAFAWLAGHTSGRLFVEWNGPSRIAFAANLVWLWLVLAIATLRAGRQAGWGRVARPVLLAVLSVVPWTFWSGTRVAFHPPINPASGGPTGAGLLASSLGLVAVLLLAPALLGLRRTVTASRAGGVWLLLGLHFALFLWVRGEHSHREPLQVIALSSLIVWIPLLVRVWRAFAWPVEVQRWVVALVAWGGALAGSSIVPYLAPGTLDAWKFTHALVAHAHLAMAGMLTSFVGVILAALVHGTRMQSVLAAPRRFLLWHAGCAFYVLSMGILGGLEAGHPGLVFRPGAVVLFLFSVRWLAGAMMTGAAIAWLRGALRVTVGTRSTEASITATGALREAS